MPPFSESLFNYEDDNDTFSSFNTNSTSNSNDNTYDDDSRRNPSKISGMYNGTGTSCHHCKSRKESDELYFCSNLFCKKTSSDSKRKCHKKYCITCMNKFYHAEYTKNEMGQAGDLNNEWACPCCKNCCRCTACLKSNSKKNVISDVSTSLITNELKSIPVESLAPISICEKSSNNIANSSNTSEVKDLAQVLITHYKKDDIGAMNRSSIHLLNAMLELQAQKEKNKTLSKRKLSDLVPNFESKIPTLPQKKHSYIASPLVTTSTNTIASPIIYHLNHNASSVNLDPINQPSDLAYQ